MPAHDSETTGFELSLLMYCIVYQDLVKYGCYQPGLFYSVTIGSCILQSVCICKLVFSYLSYCDCFQKNQSY